MQCYKVTKSVTIHSFKVDPTRSSQHFCPSLTMSANPSSSLSLLTHAGDPGWFVLLSQTLSCQPHISHAVHLKRDGRLLPGALYGASSCGVICSPLLFPGYFSIQVLTVHLLTFQSRAMQFSAEASLPL